MLFTLDWWWCRSGLQRRATGARWDGGGGEGMCERVKYCRQTPPAAAETAQSKEGGGGEGEWLCRDEDTQQTAEHARAATI